MYVIKANDKQYKFKQRWNEITINESIALYEVIEAMPEKLKELYELLAKKHTDEVQKEIDKLNGSIGNKETKKLFPAFYGKVLKVLSNMPQAIINKIDWSQRTELYYFKMADGVSNESVVIGLLHAPFDYISTNMKSFKFGEEVLFLPTTTSVMGEDIPLYNETALAFAESADIELFADEMAGGRYKWAVNTISILCRPEGEEYDEKTSLARAEKMGELTMDIFWEVFFCSIKCFNISNANTLTYLLQSVSVKNALRKTPGLVDLDGTDISYQRLLASLTSELSKKRMSMTSSST